MVGRVAVVGVGQTYHEEAKSTQSYYDVAFEAATKALEDAALDKGEIDTVIASGWDVTDGRTISDMYLVPAASGYLKDSAKAAEDGVLAFAYAWMRLAAGAFDTALVIAHGQSEHPPELISNIVFDPFFFRPIAACGVTTLALQACAYASKYGVTPEQAAGVAVKNRRNAVDNPYAHLRSPVSVEDVVRSPPVASPLRTLDCPPRSVGAVALVLAAGERMRRIRPDAAWVHGIGWAVDGYDLGATDLSRLPSLAAATARAYATAGVKDPLEELDVAEVHDVTSYHELMAYEALGWAQPGGGARLLEQGITGRGGKLPVNPSGGVLSTNLHAGSGLLRVAEAALQVTGRAGAHQVEGARRALAHGMSAAAGVAAAGNCVVVLGRD
jgi:acetyl-CoA C-acetyltransferase